MSYRWRWSTYVRVAAINLTVVGVSYGALAGAGLILGKNWVSWSGTVGVLALSIAPSVFSFVADRVIWYSIDHYAPKNCPHCGRQLDEVEWV